MTDQSDIFSSKEQTTQSDPLKTTIAPDNQLANLLAEIKNEQGEQKYSSLEEALKGTKSAQEYIPQLKSQNSTLEAEVSTLRAQLEKLGTVEEVVSRLTANSSKQEAPAATPAASPLSQDAIAKMIKDSLQETKQSEAALANEKNVNDVLSTKFGDKARELVKAKADELGISLEKLQTLSRESPSMVLALFQQSPVRQSTTTTSSVSDVLAGKVVNNPATPATSLLSGSASGRTSEGFRLAKQHIYDKLGVQSN